MKIPITFFAPAEREPVEVIRRQAQGFSAFPLLRVFLNASLDYMFLLNEHRQIVLASDNVLELVPGKTLDQLIGLRPGEALGCVHAFECESGCGTSQFCRKCGVVRTVLSGLNGTREVQECDIIRIVNGRQETLRLRAQTTPVMHRQERFTLLAFAPMREGTR